MNHSEHHPHYWPDCGQEVEAEFAYIWVDTGTATGSSRVTFSPQRVRS